jgi:hypothetical protein
MSVRPGIAATSLWRRGMAMALLAVAGCGNGVGGPAPDARAVSVSGNLTLKGAQPGAWWALTDDQGRVWKISGPTAEQVAAFQLAQNRRVTVQGQLEEKYLGFEQIRPLRINIAP